MSREINEKEIAKFVEEDISKLSSEEMEQKNKEQLEEMERQFQEFKSNFDQGNCYLCNQRLDSVKESDPCIHWLLRKNKRFKKNKHFKGITKKYSMFQIQCYLRWVSNKDKPFQNINDFEDEVKNPQNFEATIKYENLTWSFSCSDNDFAGHGGDKTNFPHYHFQMKVDNGVLIKYNDFHIPLTDTDRFNILLFKNHGDTFKHTFGRGESVTTMFEKFSPEEIIEMATTDWESDGSTFNFSNIIEADPGTTISGDDFVDIIKESQETRVPVAKLMKKLKNVRTTTIVSASEEIVDHAAREGGRGSVNKKSLKKEEPKN